MPTFTLPFFGELDLADLEEGYDSELTLDGETVQADLNFDVKTIDPSRLEIVKQLLESLAELDQKNKGYILRDFEDNDADTVRGYVDHHLEDLASDEVSALIDPNLPDPGRQLMNKLRMTRLGFYPDDGEGFVICDYSIGEELTNYLVVLVYNEAMELEDLTMES